MEEKLAVKTNAVELLEEQLATRAKKNQFGFIVLSSSTDPYLQIEKDQQLTRQLLEVILKFGFPVHIITKSNLVIRDFDLLHEINKHAILPIDLQHKLNQKVFITFSFSSLDQTVSKIFEPGATAPHDRLAALRQSLKNGFHSGVSFMPLIPYISDTGENLNKMFKVFQDVGVNYILPSSITLFGSGPHDSKTLVFHVIQRHYPHLQEKYKKLFSTGSQMPAYYLNALTKKTNEMCTLYGLKNRIV